MDIGNNRRASVKLIAILTQCILLFLVLIVRGSHAGTACYKYNVADIVFAVDTTSSLTESDFENVKTELKKIVAGFTITEPSTRLGLISISNQARVISNLDSRNSMELNAAIDTLTFSSGNAKLSEGIRVAKESVLTKAANSNAKRTKLLILVKDRRSEKACDSAELISIASETAGLKSVGATVNAVGIGGLWNQQELESLFGTEYLMFKNKNSIDSVKSLNNPVCLADCPRNGTVAQKYGLCYNHMRHAFNYKIALISDNSGNSVCRTQIERNTEKCDQADSTCIKRNRIVGPCESNKVTIVNQWQSFDPKLQSCITTDDKRIVDCADAQECTDQVADIMFILDTSGSMGEHNVEKVIQATHVFVEFLKIGPGNVRVGVLTFNTGVTTEIELGLINNKVDLLQKIHEIPSTSSGGTNTAQALLEAEIILSTDGRQNVQKYVFIFTDGSSNNQYLTLERTKKIKEVGITLFAIGVGNINRFELTEMTAPETSTNLFIFENFDDMIVWSKAFSKSLCIQLASPIPKLCDDSVFVQSISECSGQVQRVTRTEYKYNSVQKCIKTFHITEFQHCRSKCLDPINGNEYLNGDVWESFCYQFQCKESGAVDKISEKCRAADGTCWDDGTGPFQCLNDLGEQLNNCYCNYKAITVMDSY